MTAPLFIRLTLNAYPGVCAGIKSVEFSGLLHNRTRVLNPLQANNRKYLDVKIDTSGKFISMKY